MSVSSPNITHPRINQGAGGTGPELIMITGNNTNSVSFVPNVLLGHVNPADSEWSLISNGLVSSITIRYEESSISDSTPDQNGPIGLYVSCVAIDTDGSALKLVDRMQFSQANFSPEFIKGWQK